MRHFIKFFFTLCFTLLFSACSTKYVEPTTINDLIKYPQEAATYSKNTPNIDYSQQLLFDEQFNKTYFKPWHIVQLSLTQQQATWGNAYAQKKMYGDNHKLISKKWFEQQINNANFEQYNSKLQKAITVRNSSLRVFPTISKIFYNPEKAGQGFPFDYNQNSGIKINSPLLISHFSKDRAWVYVESSFAAGWIKVNDIAFVSNKIASKFQSGNYYVAIKDNFSLLKNGIFKEYIKVGTIFPKTKSGKYLTIGKDINLNGFLSTVKLKENQIDKKPIKMNPKNIQVILDELIQEPYGWGELLNHRDCSALTRDFIAPFGIYLGRNSATQKQDGKYYDMQTMTPKEKKEFLVNKATPFLSLVYLKGHIMLYIGEHEGEPLVFHNIWGIKTLNDKESGRFIIGQAVVTSLEPGRELKYFDAKKSLIHKIQGISNLMEKTPNEEKNEIEK